MNDFTPLRKKALAKRDKAIDLARAEYRKTMNMIAVLEQQIDGHVPLGHMTVSKAIEQVIPADRPFTVDDVWAGLLTLDPKRNWRRSSIHNHLTRMRDRGSLKRIRRHSKTRPTLYAMEGVDYEPPPFEDMSLSEVVAQVAADLPEQKTLTEFTTILLERGYETDMEPKVFRDAVGHAVARLPSKTRAKVQRAT